MIEVTERQKETLDFIEGFVKEKGYAPSFREIANGIGVTVGAIQKLLEKLQRKGVIKKASGLSRGIRVLRKENSIPIFAFVKAGSPGIADEEPVDYLTIEGTLGVKAGDRGMLVRGDSMIDAGITHGSIVFYRKVDYINENAIVIARVGEGPVVKRFTRSGGRIVLKSENPHYKPIMVDPKDGDSNLEILGKVISVVKNYAKSKPRREGFQS
ncbi:MAG: transcriptional repressor LexA [Candidatus Kryptoniota bacterium]